MNKGIEKEAEVVKYFLSIEYDILHRRYKTKYGEIDIIAFDKNSKNIVFCEVKYRSQVNDYENLVSKKQWSRIIDASQIFIQNNNKYLLHDYRYDLVILEKNTNINHIKNIFFD